MAHKRPPPPWIHPCAYPGFKPQSLKSMLRLISIGLTKLKVKYVLKDFDQDFNHLTAKEFSTLNLNEKGFLFKKKRKEKRNMEIRKAVLCHVCSLIISSNSQWEQGNKNKEKKFKRPEALTLPFHTLPLNTRCWSVIPVSFMSPYPSTGRNSSFSPWSIRGIWEAPDQHFPKSCTTHLYHMCQHIQQLLFPGFAHSFL